MNSMENIDTDVQGWRVKGLVFINALRRGGGKNEFERDHMAFKRNGGGLAGRQSIKGGP